MSAAAIDAFTGQPDPGLTADAALEARIDAAYDLMIKAPTDEESKEQFSVVNRLIRQRSPTQLLKLEMERRQRARGKA